MAGIIVSLALSSRRLSSFHRVLETLLRQTLKPDAIIVWISEQPYLLDRGVRLIDLPPKVKVLADCRENRIEIRKTENTGPYRKLLPALELVRNDHNPPVIVTADDDTLYPNKWLEVLVDAYNDNGCACAFRARHVFLNPAGNNCYDDWPLLEAFDELKTCDLIITAGEGMLVSPAMFDPRILMSDFKYLAPSRSDLWFCAALLAKKTSVFKLSKKRLSSKGQRLRLTTRGDFPLSKSIFSGISTKKNTLYLYNKAKNDQMLRQTFSYFGLIENN